MGEDAAVAAAAGGEETMYVDAYERGNIASATPRASGSGQRTAPGIEPAEKRELYAKREWRAATGREWRQRAARPANFASLQD